MSNNELLDPTLFSDMTDFFWHKDKSLEKNVFSFLGDHLKQLIATFLAEAGVKDKPLILGEVEAGAVIKGPVYIAKGVTVEAGAYIVGPTVIEEKTEVRHGAYLRGNCLIGRNCVVGHTTEVKGSVFCHGAKAGHFAYVGDSILGQNVNLGAGTKLANLPFSHKDICYIHPLSGKKLSTGLRKFGAILGTNAQTGCNSVLSPGTLLMPDAVVMPCQHFRGTMHRK